jgi:hypothetical protein
LGEEKDLRKKIIERVVRKKQVRKKKKRAFERGSGMKC